MPRHAQPLPDAAQRAHTATSVSLVCQTPIYNPSSLFSPSRLLPVSAHSKLFSPVQNPFSSPFHLWLIKMTRVSVSQWWCHRPLWRDCPARALLCGSSFPAVACCLACRHTQKREDWSCLPKQNRFITIVAFDKRWLHHFSRMFLINRMALRYIKCICWGMCKMAIYSPQGLCPQNITLQLLPHKNKGNHSPFLIILLQTYTNVDSHIFKQMHTRACTHFPRSKIIS